MIAQVYCTTNTVNGKKYIGQNKTCNASYLGSGKLLKRSIKKYGKHCFVKDILWEGPVEYVDEMELYWIEYFYANTNKMFYNICENANPPVLRGEANGFYRKKHSSESIEKIKQSRKEQKNINYRVGLEKMHSEESVLKRVKTFKELYSKGLITHWSKGQTKENNEILAAIGRKISKTTVGRESKNKKPIFCKELNKSFDSVTQASRELGLNQGDISNVLAGRQKSTKQYTFTYL
jgi:group I intron endonuclease